MTVFRLLHLTAFVVPLGVFTTLLLVPRPLPEMPAIDWDLMYLMNKTAHSGGYAYLTVIGFLYFHSGEARTGVVLFMLLHGIGTEIGQTYTGRHGCVQDVLIDWGGIGVGLLVARRISRLRRREKDLSPNLTGSHPMAARPE